jgi:hypothetical protein
VLYPSCIQATLTQNGANKTANMKVSMLTPIRAAIGKAAPRAISHGEIEINPKPFENAAGLRA